MSVFPKLSFLAAFAVVLLALSSCADKCPDTQCLNLGTCVDGTCQCPAGLSGKFCEVSDTVALESFLYGTGEKIWQYVSVTKLNEVGPLTQQQKDFRAKFMQGGLVQLTNTPEGNMSGSWQLTGYGTRVDIVTADSSFTWRVAELGPDKFRYYSSGDKDLNIEYLMTPEL